MSNSRLVFWLQWIVVTAVSMVVFAVFKQQLSQAVETAVTRWTDSVFTAKNFNVPVVYWARNWVPDLVIVGLSGTIAGIGQFFLIRKIISRPQRWIAASIIGMLFGYFVYRFLRDSLPLYVLFMIDRYLLATIFYGAVIAIFQGLVLRRQISQRLWIVLNSLGFALGAAIIKPLPELGFASTYSSAPYLLAINSIVQASILVLLWRESF
ncbi:MAG: hypothetical protein VKL59_22570 [Nostocaceae cyanobacterium]|nr:hypothetical protein [Nostocaceae cyanobacterium]